MRQANGFRELGRSFVERLAFSFFLIPGTLTLIPAKLYNRRRIKVSVPGIGKSAPD